MQKYFEQILIAITLVFILVIQVPIIYGIH